MFRPYDIRMALLTGVSCLALATAWDAANAQALPATSTPAATTTSAKSAKAAPTNSGTQKPVVAKDVVVAQNTAHSKPAPGQQPADTGIETVVVTAQKKKEDVQTVPIAITALSQQQLTERQIAGGPDLVKEVPNLTFSKTNFSGYNLEIRGIGTEAISVTTDPAVAVAFNDIPFIRNHFFEQEFYDLQDAEVLRGPQGTLYGRNATAGVVNIKSALPTDTYEAMMSVDVGNYDSQRLEGMVNIPIVSDELDLRIAGEWTKRDGYTEDTTTDTAVDGRDLWSGRMTLGWKPASNVQTYLVWEHFSEDDDRLRSGKQLCETDYGPGEINGMPKPVGNNSYGSPGDYFTQGCSSNVSLYSPNAFEAPLGYALPYVLGLEDLGRGNPINPYASVTQSTNLRDIESSILPQYRAKNDTLEFNASWEINPSLTFTSQTGYNNDFLWSTEDYNRFGSTPGLFTYIPPSPGNPGSERYGVGPDPSGLNVCTDQTGCGPTQSIAVGQACPSGKLNGCQLAGYFCDPQVGCSDSLIAEDLSTERAWQLSQEFRISSNFSGPFNFTAGGNFLHYETVEKYYVFSNAFTLINSNGFPEFGYQYNTPGDAPLIDHGYVDPNPISSLNDQGHNYYLSQNPYVLNSYAIFGDANYKVTKDFTLTGGLRYTDDQKHFLDIPSWLATEGYGYPVTGEVNQSWERLTGRAVANWTPQLDFTDQTLVYGSYAHGYKAGGANPPGAEFVGNEDVNGQSENVNPLHPLTFKPEYIEAFELGTKNTLLDGALTLNGDIFYYNYTGYQVSEIVDRTAVNSNYNAHVEGAELETDWQPAPGLKFSFNSGFENSGVAGGTEAVDLMDRTAGTPGWYLVKPFVNEASNCVFPAYVAQWIVNGSPAIGANAASYCSIAYEFGLDPLTQLPYVPNPTTQAGGGPCCTNTSGQVITGYPGFNPATAPNDGAGFSKDIGGNQLPNAPHFTTSLTAEYTIPVSSDWTATLHGDFYWQSQQWARVFEDPIDKIHGYENVNLSLILNSANGWQVMAYVKNVFDVTAITGTFLNSDDSGLTTNVFLTDPRLFGIRVTKRLDENDGFWGSEWSGADLITNLFSDTDKGMPKLWIELGGGFDQIDDSQQTFTPPFFSAITAPLNSPVGFEHPPNGGFDYDAKLTFEPEGSDWVLSAAVRYGRASRSNHMHQQTHPGTVFVSLPTFGLKTHVQPSNAHYIDAFNTSSEQHAIFDFAVGKDVGLGMLGLNGNSVINGGVRMAQFAQSSHFTIHTDPDYVFNKLGPKYNHNYTGSDQTKRNFHGIGPSLSWDASTPVMGESETSGISFDWGMNGAVLFGRQIAQIHHQTTGVYRCRPILHGGCHKGVLGTQFSNYSYASQYHSRYQRSANSNRRRMVAVPNIGAFAGVSWRYSNAKVSFGYRADEFFGAMDGGIDVRKSENVGFFGPFANISIGLGG